MDSALKGNLPDIQTAYHLDTHSLFPRLLQLQRLFFAERSDLFASKLLDPERVRTVFFDIASLAYVHTVSPERAASFKLGATTHCFHFEVFVFLPPDVDRNSIEEIRECVDELQHDQQKWSQTILARQSIFSDVPDEYAPVRRPS